MTKKINKLLVIEREVNNKCSLCGKISETRPYGKNGALICFECGHSPENIKETTRRMKKLVNSVDGVIINVKSGKNN